MNNKVNNKSEFKCNICIKYYSSKSSLCNHNKKFHNESSDNILKSSDNLVKSSDNILKSSDNRTYNCRKCNKIFNNVKTRWSHEQKCKNKATNKDEINQLKNIINELKAQVTMILREKGKIHHKTLQKINNQLNNINNGSIINNTYVKFGELDYERILNSKQVKNILNKQFKCLEESIKQIHFNDQLPEYNNIFITNMKDDIAYVFNGKQFISVRKNEMLNELIDSHVNEINLSLEKNKNKINEYYVNKIEEFLNKLNDDTTKFTDNNNYKAYKITYL